LIIRWVGDQTGNWDGIKAALKNMIHSAWRNYLNFGCDIGGYRTQHGEPLGRSKNVFIRWFQMGTFLPLMENGGNGEHRQVLHLF
jgi:alpha-glucosidase (family GH31 glycosyl hydrolase)